MPAKPRDITGQRFDMLVAIAATSRRERGAVVWSLRCDCGNIVERPSGEVVRGHVKSCGCLRKEHGMASIANITHLGAQATRTHGMTNTKAYQAWNSMKQRCMNAKSKDYPRYGGRGIKICDRWLSFENFLADMGEKPRDMTLDRIDNDGDYEPGNCRWASARTQSNNRRSNHCLTYEGKTQTLSEWSRETGIEKATLLNRIKNGWDTKAVLTTSVDYGNGWKNGARN